MDAPHTRTTRLLTILKREEFKDTMQDGNHNGQGQQVEACLQERHLCDIHGGSYQVHLCARIHGHESEQQQESSVSALVHSISLTCLGLSISMINNCPQRATYAMFQWSVLEWQKLRKQL